jgi:hypothetical protein
VKSTQCENATIVTQPVGLLGVQSTLLPFYQTARWIGTTLTGAGKISGVIARAAPSFFC